MPESPTPTHPDSPLEVLGLSDRTVMRLHRDRIRSVGALCSRTAVELLTITKLGAVQLEEIRQALASHGLKLRPGSRVVEDIELPEL